MKVIVACEFSGIVRDAFLEAGHEAISIDLLPSESSIGPHIVKDVRSVDLGWADLLIAHPPCTYLANSGVRWLTNRDGSQNEERWAEMVKAAGLFEFFLEAPVERIAVENPVMHKYARWAIGDRRPDQYVQPYQFGHGETKKTGLWLKNLPLLEPTEIVDGREPRVHHASPGPDRWKERSRFYPGIAKAMAEQWGSL